MVGTSDGVLQGSAARHMPWAQVREVVDREEWNDRVLSLPGHDLHQGYEWGEVRASQGWHPRRIAILEQGECAAAVSVLIRPLPLLGRAILYAPGGPLVRRSDPALWASLLAAISAIAAETRAVFLRVDPAVPRDGAASSAWLERWGFAAIPEDWTTWNTPRVVMRLDLGVPEEELRKNLRRRHREYVASAAKRGVVVRPAESVEESWEFHRALTEAGQRKGLPVRGRAYFERLWREYVRAGAGVLLVAEHEGRAVGGLLAARFGAEAYMLHAVVRDADARVLHHGPLLYWEFIRWAKSIGCTAIDWGGVGTNYPAHETDPGYGLYHFKLGFNSQLEHLVAYHDLVFAPRLYKTFRLLEGRLGACLWRTRARLNESFSRMDGLFETIAAKARQFRIGVQQRGLAETLYWAAFGFLRPNRFGVLVRDLGAGIPEEPLASNVSFQVCDATTLAAWREGRHGLPTPFFQDEIDGVDTCALALVEGSVVAVLWIYRQDDPCRRFALGEGEAEINHVVVLPAYRRKMLGKDLLRFACQWLQQQGHRTVYALVHSSNRPSLRAFESVGFHERGRVLRFLLYRPKVRAAGALPRAGGSR
jgi:lipid II:glycine glycyltransferase (peptidoglycan interpeptide bridge formation enzyme)/ribosomal protein S18 acetylase RimI-like enzyme